MAVTVSTNNTIETQKLATVVALEVAKNAGFLKLASKDYFGSQINGNMKAGQSYDFILPDAGNTVDGLVANPRDIVERKVSLSIKNKVNSVKTNALEGVTDIKWEKEIGPSYAANLINKTLKEEVGKAVKEATTVFVGSGFKPIAEAGAYLQSITTEDLQGFIDPMAQAVLAANGQAFVPTGSPDALYGKGTLGNFQGVDYKSERWLDKVKVNLTAESAGVAGYTASTAQTDPAKIQLSGVSGTIKAGTPIFVDGCYACDTIGMETNAPYAFIAMGDVSANGVISAQPIYTADNGTRTCSKAPAAGDSVTLPDNGNYGLAYIRAKDAYNFSQVDKLDIKFSKEAAVGDVDGLRVSLNQWTDGTSAENFSRWDFTYLAGTVEPRLVTLAMFKNA